MKFAKIKTPRKFLFIQYIEGFHVTSHQANFASHHTRNPHAGFLLAWQGIGKHNQMSHYLLFHTTIPNYNRVTKILAHRLGGNFKSFCEVDQKCKHFFFLHHATQKGRGFAGANSLFWDVIEICFERMQTESSDKSCRLKCQIILMNRRLINVLMLKRFVVFQTVTRGGTCLTLSNEHTPS